MAGSSSARPRRAPKKNKHKMQGGRRIKMSSTSGARICELTQEFGFRSEAETIQWLLEQAEESHVRVTGTETVPAVDSVTTGGALTIPATKEEAEPVYDESVSELAPVGSKPMFVPGRGYWIMTESGEQQVWPVPLALTGGIGMRMQSLYAAELNQNDQTSVSSDDEVTEAASELVEMMGKKCWVCKCDINN